MPAVCLYFQIHQPRRLRHYTVFDTAADYFDDSRNAEILNRIAQRCYLPANAILRRLVDECSGQFRFAISVSGVALEAMARYTPQVLMGLQDLAQTGQVEFLGETFHHSLAALYSATEFAEQVKLHRAAVQQHLGYYPQVFRNTELILDNHIARLVADLGFSASLCEGWGSVLASKPGGKGKSAGGNNPSGISPAGGLYLSAAAPLKLLLRNFTLSDDIAFRFSRQDWAEWPLTAPKFAQRISTLQDGPLCNLFMDYETFGEHQHAESGIMDFLAALPQAVLAAGHTFATPSDLVQATTPSPTTPTTPPLAAIDIPRAISWADEARDLSAWLGNAMQTHTAQELYKLEAPIKKSDDPQLLADWRNLTTSDHLYYMSTKRAADGQVHAHFSPYESPYDAYINFMNVLDNLRTRIKR